MKRARFAVIAMAVAPLVTGCAYGPALPPQAELGQTLLNAYEQTMSLQKVSASVEESVQVDSQAVTSGKGSSALWFSQHAGRSQFVIAGTKIAITVVRIANDYYQSNAEDTLAKSRINLLAIGKATPEELPQILVPGLDPFQMVILLGALQWPDTITAIGPVVVTDVTGQHTEDQLSVDTAKLAKHEAPADSAWLLAMSRETGGSQVTVDVTLKGNRIGSVSARLPIPVPNIKIDPAKAKEYPGLTLESPQPVSSIVVEVFDYQAFVPKLTPPA